MVYNNDPKSTQATAWTEWVIDLQAFQGVTLTNVNTITIGFGAKNSPAADKNPLIPGLAHLDLRDCGILDIIV